LVIKRKTKKNWKYRGKRTRGYGRISGGHRKSGHRGGFGGAGLKDHHWIKSIKEGFKSQFGFVRHHDGVNPVRSINVGQLDNMVETLAKQRSGLIGVENGVYVIELKNLGYDKLLGGGVVRHKLNVTLDSCTERARNKIEAVGGSINEIAEKIE
jgi:large subunit ribosomal protein L15